ncbi:MAG: ParB/RepB/Spo0J family partition protein [SAR324 cluster bacterium]|nr:ParB/RepB/Spo0J family partition protein [SAR324 cluster bacterium]
MVTKRKALGKGLGALFKNEINPLDGSFTNQSKYFLELPHDQVVPDKTQARKNFDLVSLQELADSISTKGIIQPIVVRKLSEGKYSIIAGERRWHAAKLAGFEKVPAVIRDYKEDEILELSLIENIQRSDLNPIEEAQAYQSLLKSNNYLQEDIAKRVGKSRAYVANSLRLLKLPDRIKTELLNNNLQAGHARALLSLEDANLQNNLVDIIISDGLSVRKVEELVNEFKSTIQKKTPHKKSALSIKDANNTTERLQQKWENIDDLTSDIRNSTKTKAIIKLLGYNRGKIEISFDTIEQFNYLYNILTK